MQLFLTRGLEQVSLPLVLSSNPGAGQGVLQTHPSLSLWMPRAIPESGASLTESLPLVSPDLLLGPEWPKGWDGEGPGCQPGSERIFSPKLLPLPNFSSPLSRSPNNPGSLSLIFSLKVQE